MGITAPSSSDTQAAILTALLSYNRPLIFLALFIVLFGITFILSKKNFALSLAISLFTTVLYVLYIVVSYLNSIRY